MRLVRTHVGAPAHAGTSYALGRGAALSVVLAGLAVRQARADGFVEVTGGAMLPMATGYWTDFVNASPKVGVHAGAEGASLGLALSIDITSLDFDMWGAQLLPTGHNYFSLTSRRIDPWRMRALVHAIAHTTSGRVRQSLRLGVGVDTVRTRYVVCGSCFFVGEPDIPVTDYDSGLAIELGYGVWFAASRRWYVGAEVAVPISVQRRSDGDREPKLDYTSFDVDVLAGARFVFSVARPQRPK